MRDAPTLEKHADIRDSRITKELLDKYGYTRVAWAVRPGSMDLTRGFTPSPVGERSSSACAMTRMRPYNVVTNVLLEKSNVLIVKEKNRKDLPEVQQKSKQTPRWRTRSRSLL